MPWVAGDPVTSPTADQVLADTGPIQLGGPFRGSVLISCKTGFDAIVEVRRPGNLATRLSHILTVQPGNAEYTIGPFQLVPQERVRVKSRNAMAGVLAADAEVSVSITYERRS